MSSRLAAASLALALLLAGAAAHAQALEPAFSSELATLALRALHDEGLLVKKGDTVVVLTSGQFKALAPDSDLGPFIAVARDRGNGMVAVVFMLGEPTMRGIFFDELRPTAWSELTRGVPAEKRKETVAGAVKPFTRPPSKGWQATFDSVESRADDGTPVPSLRVTRIVKGTP